LLAVALAQLLELMTEDPRNQWRSWLTDLVHGRGRENGDAALGRFYAEIERAPRVELVLFEQLRALNADGPRFSNRAVGPAFAGIGGLPGGKESLADGL
jgi:hypothetical protein